MADSSTTHAVGRRKDAVCRVYIRPGSGKWDVNGRTVGDYFPRAALVSARALLVKRLDAESLVFDWLHCEILAREAEGLLGGDWASM